ncbi:hypothetical protein PT974_02651 [Cladobotryum mycophilum]|uniref:Uncharacterized protein n=1 Tax=Cladobotryum mycophilum TaxID=491253 RepID=A0ABR0SZY6_9HYPO
MESLPQSVPRIETALEEIGTTLMGFQQEFKQLRAWSVNQEIRRGNARRADDGGPFKPLVDVRTDHAEDAILGFPTTLAQLEQLDSATADGILEFLEQSGDGLSLLFKHEAIRAAMMSGD